MLLELTDEELRAKFQAIEKPQDVAELLDVNYRRLVYIIYLIPPTQQYKAFLISKRGGGSRKISVPATDLKIIQQRLNQVLSSVYRRPESAFGFVREQNIVKNAELHTGKRYVFNLDLIDFFPSINFGRVRGLFMAYPYSIKPSVATILAQICCHENELPQGAPTSPIVSNLICRKLDHDLMLLAKRTGCEYSRYADDITFSTDKPFFPHAIAETKSGDIWGRYRVGPILKEIINDNGFEVNIDKVRMQHATERQVVTGLVVNEHVNVSRNYVRQIRAMLHAWEKYGLDAAEREYYRRFSHKNRGPYKRLPSFQQIVKGKVLFLRMVKGPHDPVYQRYRNKLASLGVEIPAPSVVPATEEIKNLEELRPRKRVKKPEILFAAEELQQLETPRVQIDIWSWIKHLPFPLASIVWTYHTIDEEDKKFDHLIDFFEATVQFMATILLSALKNDESLFEQELIVLRRALEKQHLSWELSTFGLWRNTFERLSKVFRKKIKNGSEDMAEIHRLFKTNDLTVVSMLCDVRWSSLFQETNHYRNRWRGHGGVVSLKEGIIRHKILYDYLLRSKDLFGDCWERYELALPLDNRFKDGFHRYRTKRLMGNNTPFEGMRVRLRETMNDEQLHLISKASYSALELLPMFKIMHAPESEKNACYFFNRREKSGDLTLVAYHLETESAVIDQFPDISETIDLLI